MTQRAHTSHWTLTICAIHWAYITQKALIPGLAHIAQRTCATHWAHMTKKATRTDLLSKKTKSIQNTSSTYYSKEHAVYITDYHTKGTSNTLRSYYAERTAIVERIWHQYGRTHWGIITQSLNRIWHKKNVHYIEHLIDKIICHKKYMPSMCFPPKYLTTQRNRHARLTHWSFLYLITSHIYRYLFHKMRVIKSKNLGNLWGTSKLTI